MVSPMPVAAISRQSMGNLHMAGIYIFRTLEFQFETQRNGQ